MWICCVFSRRIVELFGDTSLIGDGGCKFVIPTLMRWLADYYFGLDYLCPHEIASPVSRIFMEHKYYFLSTRPRYTTLHIKHTRARHKSSNSLYILKTISKYNCLSAFTRTQSCLSSLFRVYVPRSHHSTLDYPRARQ